MKIRLWVAAIAAAASVAACATLPPNPLTAEQRTSLYVTEVRVTIAPAARLDWPDYVSEKTPTGPVAAGGPNAADGPSPAIAPLPPEEADALVRAAVSDRVATAVREQFRTRRAGPRPVRVIVQVNQFTAPSGVQRVFVGGVPTLRAEAVVVDAATGATIVSYPDSPIVGSAGGGPVGVLVDRAIGGQTGMLDRVAVPWAGAFANWLYGPTS